MARIMVIEDEPNIALVLDAVLTDRGHQVVTAADGILGLKKLKESKQVPEVVLLDLLMPNLSGRAVAESIRADQVLCEIPIIIMSGSMPNSKDFPPEGTYHAYISKPFDLSEVISTVESLINRGSIV